MVILIFVLNFLYEIIEDKFRYIFLQKTKNIYNKLSLRLIFYDIVEM